MRTTDESNRQELFLRRPGAPDERAERANRPPSVSDFCFHISVICVVTTISKSFVFFFSCDRT